MTAASRLPAQRGNTFVGIIIGLVIGLAIAVVVALMITKGATPFTDKIGKMVKPAEPSASQITDPNKPMYGNKDTVKEASRETAAIAPPTVATAPSTVPAPPPADPLAQVIATFKNEAAAPAKVEAKRDLRPQLRAEQDPRSVPPPAAEEEKWVYYLQVGAFRASADAESTRAKMALLGFEAAVTDRNTDNGVLHRVRLGPYAQVEAMNRARSKLTEGGIDAAVVRNPK